MKSFWQLFEAIKDLRGLKFGRGLMRDAEDRFRRPETYIRFMLGLNETVKVYKNYFEIHNLFEHITQGLRNWYKFFAETEVENIVNAMFKSWDIANKEFINFGNILERLTKLAAEGFRQKVIDILSPGFELDYGDNVTYEHDPEKNYRHLYNRYVVDDKMPEFHSYNTSASNMTEAHNMLQILVFDLIKYFKLSNVKTIMGTLQYMAPEILGGTKAGRKAKEVLNRHPEVTDKHEKQELLRQHAQEIMQSSGIDAARELNYTNDVYTMIKFIELLKDNSLMELAVNLTRSIKKIDEEIYAFIHYYTRCFIYFSQNLNNTNATRRIPRKIGQIDDYDWGEDIADADSIVDPAANKISGIDLSPPAFDGTKNLRKPFKKDVA